MKVRLSFKEDLYYIQYILCKSIIYTYQGASNMTYNELGIFGYLRKVLRCGPVQTFLKLVDFWKPISPLLIAAKVNFLYIRYDFIKRSHSITYLLLLLLLPPLPLFNRIPLLLTTTNYYYHHIANYHYYHH